MRHLYEELFQRLQVGRISTRPTEQRVPFDLFDHRRDVLGRYGYAPQCDVLQHLDENAAQAEHEDGTEGRVAGDADDGLDAWFGHFLHGDALDVLPSENAGYGLICISRLLPVPYIELYPAGVRFMDDLGRDDFHSRVAADCVEGIACLLLGAGKDAARRRDPLFFKDRLRLMLHQVTPFFRCRFLDDFPRCLCHGSLP